MAWPDDQAPVSSQLTVVIVPIEVPIETKYDIMKINDVDIDRIKRKSKNFYKSK